MFDILFEFLFGKPKEKKLEWVANVNACYTVENEVMISWQYLLFVDEDGSRICKLSIEGKGLAVCNNYGGPWNHHRYGDVVVPWLHGCCLDTKYCSTYNSHSDLAEHFVYSNAVPGPVIEKPKTSATILKLVKNDDKGSESSTS